MKNNTLCFCHGPFAVTSLGPEWCPPSERLSA
jgi:hypothetical protein